MVPATARAFSGPVRSMKHASPMLPGKSCSRYESAPFASRMKTLFPTTFSRRAPGAS